MTEVNKKRYQHNDFSFVQPGDCPGYAVDITKLERHFAEATVYRATGWPDETSMDSEPCLDVYLKWDGCGHYSLRRESFHLCGRSNTVEFAQMLPWLFDELGKRIPAWRAETAQ